MFTEAEIRRQFTYHPPRADQLPRYEQIRAAALVFAMSIVNLTPPGADQSAAIRKLRECVMTVNAAIALEPVRDSTYVEQGVPNDR